MNRMRAFTDSAHSIESRNTNACGEVAIGSAADCGFFQPPVDVLRDRLRLLVERDHTSIALHWQAVDATGNLELAVLVVRLQGAHLAVESSRLLRALDTHIDLGTRLRCDDVRARASMDHAGVHRNPALQIVELCDDRDLASEFENSAVTF